MFLGLVQTCSKAVTGSNTIFTLGVSEPCTGRRQPPLVASMQCWYCKCYVLLGIHRYPFTTFCILVGIVLPTIYVLLSTQQRFSIDTNFNWMNLKNVTNLFSAEGPTVKGFVMTAEWQTTTQHSWRIQYITLWLIAVLTFLISKD